MTDLQAFQSVAPVETAVGPMASVGSRFAILDTAITEIDFSGDCFHCCQICGLALSLSWVDSQIVSIVPIVINATWRTQSIAEADSVDRNTVRRKGKACFVSKGIEWYACQPHPFTTREGDLE